MTVAALLEMAVAAHGDRVAFGSLDGGETYERFASTATRVARRLRDRSTGHVAYVGPNDGDYPLIVFASALAGTPLAPLNYRLPDGQLDGLIDRLGEPLVVVHPAHRHRLSTPDGRIIESSDLRRPASIRSETALPDVSADDPAIVLFTSGTTAAPKGVVLRHAHLFSYVVQTVELSSADPDDASLVTLPPYHVAGVGSVLSNIYAGRRVVHLPDFDPARWLELARAERITNVMLVPTMLTRLIDHLAGRSADAPCLRTIAYGGARMPRQVLERALDAFPSAGFVNAYGLTETSATLAVLAPEDHRAATESSDPQVRARLSSAGRLVPVVEAQIRGDDGRIADAGEHGELWVRGPQVSGEYLEQGSSLDAEGWFPTRDRAMFDVDGYLFIDGRADDTIIRGGENVSPVEVEDVLLAHPGVADVAVVGVPDDEWGELIAAFVVPSATARLTEEGLRAWARQRLRGSRTPDRVRFCTSLPRNDLGKVVRRQLLDLVRDSEVSPSV
jgi:acyl-CoA synthetase (AMP-forming)/AMP-acid ligase II